MAGSEELTIGDLRSLLTERGFAFAAGAPMRRLIEQFGALDDWNEFAASWDDLVLDPYLVDAGRFRRRRHAVFVIDPDGTIRRGPHRPHYQSREYNALYGGIERWFDPVRDDTGSGASLRSVLHFCLAAFGGTSLDANRWQVEVHQFRIEARPGEPGLPTPEGVHRDGVDYVLVLLIARRNIVSGTTTIHAPNGQPLGSFTLTHAFDAALVDDARVFHGVTPVQPLDPALPAHRDVLVVTFRRESTAGTSG